MLEARGLVKRFHGIAAVNGVSFALAPGEVLGYLGPNGSGKSTTVKMLTGLLQPTEGTVLFNGRPIDDDPLGFRRALGYVPEEPDLYTFLSGRAYLELVGGLRGVPSEVLRCKIPPLLDLFGIGGAADQDISTYSKGMKQRVLIIAAVLHDPSILILDEPDSGLDVTTALVLRHLVCKLAEAGKAVLYSSHVLDHVEKMASRVVVLRQGHVVADDTIDHLRALMSSPTLEDVFAQLVLRVEPETIAADIVRLIHDPAHA